MVSLAAALSIPVMAGDAPFPDRGLLLLITFSVILVTLVGQGFTLPWVIGLLGIAEHGKREADGDKRREISARLASIDAALARLDTLEGAVAAPETVAAIRRRNQDRRAYFVAACQDLASRRCQQRQRDAAIAVFGGRARQHRRALFAGARSATRPAAASSASWTWKIRASAMPQKAARPERFDLFTPIRRSSPHSAARPSASDTFPPAAASPEGEEAGGC